MQRVPVNRAVFLALAREQARLLLQLARLALRRLAPYRTSNAAASSCALASISARRELNTRSSSPGIPSISNPRPSSRAAHRTSNRRVSASSKWVATMLPTAATCS